MTWRAMSTRPHDQEMTEYAYSIHDVLVEAESIDPSSEQYYAELDARMRERFGVGTDG